jgi:hypothetical protein
MEGRDGGLSRWGGWSAARERTIAMKPFILEVVN